MPRKRLFIVRPSLTTGGADRVTITLLRHLDRLRFDITLVLLHERGELLDEVPDDVRVLGLGARNILAGALPLRRLVLREAPDIVFSTSSGTNVTAALALRRSSPGRPGTRLGPRLVLSERNGLVRDQPKHKLALLLMAKRLLYPRADCITAVSRGVAADLEHRLRLDPRRLATVYNPITIPPLGTEEVPAFGEGGPRDPTPVILAAGRLVHAKGFDVLLRAFAIARAGTPCRLIILGEGPLREHLEGLALELGVAEHLSMPGFVSDPFSYMRDCSVFALSSRFEGLPGALIQAMACGSAVVASDCPFGPNEIVTHEKDGMLVQPENPEQLAQALARLLGEPGKRREMGQAAQRSAQRFSVEKTMPYYLQALDPE
jgi:glycosyltransferase involved in cell wall biosynthesis